MRKYRPAHAPGFGGAPLGNMCVPVDEATAEAAVDAAWESGARSFDTAPVYGLGLSEHRFGIYLRPHARRDRIATVCARHGVDLRAAALQFAAAHPVVSTILPASEDPQKARDNVRYLTAEIPAQFWEEL